MFDGDSIVGVVLCRADALCHAQALHIVTSVVVHGIQFAPSVAVMLTAKSMQPCSHVWNPQLLPFANETVGRRGVLTLRNEHEVKLALPTYEHVRLPTSTSVLTCSCSTFSII